MTAGCTVLLAFTGLAQAQSAPEPGTAAAPAAQSQTVTRQRPARLLVPEETQREFAALPAGKRLKILGRLIRNGQSDAAETLLRAAPFTGKFGHNRNLFMQAMITHERGDFKQAIRIYREVLANDPKLTAVRAELARALYDNKEDRSAAHHLFLLRASAPNTKAQRTFDAAINAIEARKTWSFNVWGSIAPSTNFNNGTNLEVVNVGGVDFEIGNQARERSGIGFRGGGNVGYNLRLRRDLSLIVSSGTNLVQYEGIQFDQTSLNQTALLRYRQPKYSVAFGAVSTQGWYGADEFVWSVGPQAIISYLVTPKAQFYTQLKHVWNRYEEATYRDGWTSSATTQLKYAFSDTTLLFAKAGVGRTQTERDHLSNWNGSGGAGFYHELPWGLTGFAEASVYHSVSDGNYPLLGEKRRQTRATGRMSITKRDFYWRGLAPQLEYTYTRNFSNDELSRYDSHGLALTVTRAF
ncbi:porin family protein [Anderseniella sp. Alg231-50]|uniref:porin family protein n=1 Tax=Anderseniella sp. Alg231-50 TaxID=1922226 RepID=UPI00307B82D2